MALIYFFMKNNYGLTLLFKQVKRFLINTLYKRKVKAQNYNG